MRYPATMLLLTGLLLAGCEIKTTDKRADAAAGNASGISISAPGFEGKLKLPGFALGGDHMDLDGMKLYPGSKVTGVNVDAQNDDAGQVRIAFTSDAAPAAILDYYRKAAADAGFALAPGDAALNGTKDGNKHFALDVKPAAAGSTGTILIGGS